MDQKRVVPVADPGKPGVQFRNDVAHWRRFDCAIALKEQLALVEDVGCAMGVFGKVEFQARGGWRGLGFNEER